MSITQTIQIADKPTLDNIKSSIDNNTYGLEAIKSAIDNSGGGGASPTIIIPNTGDIAGKTLTVTDDNGLFTHTVVFPNDGSTYISYPVEYLTVWYIAYQGGMLRASVSTVGGVLADSSKLPSWSDGTDYIISKMVEWDDSGKIDLSNYWSVNDERRVTISAIGSSGTYDGVSWTVGEVQPSQEITLVLMDTNKYDLVTATSSGRNKSRFVIGVKDSLSVGGYMNSSNTNVGGWNSCARRSWCNGGFRKALPDILRGIFKQFKVPSVTAYNSTTVTYSNDYFTLWAEADIFGTNAYSNQYEARVLSQISYYTTSANRIKKLNGSEKYWWERSLYAGNSTQFCCIMNNGNYYYTNPAILCGISPFGCI